MEKLTKEQPFLQRAWPKLRSYFADGTDINPEEVSPRLELIKASTWQSDLFRLATLTWSVPVSQGYGRRMRFLVWDTSNGKLLGLIALGDPVFNLRVRDEHIGWSPKYHKARLVNVLDAYVLGAVPPYNSLLGGKLVACLVRTKEVRDAFRKRYAKTRGIISQRRKKPSLLMVTTTSSLGKSAVFDRLRLGGSRYFTSIGYTRGWGHFQIPDDQFELMRQYLTLCCDKYAQGHRFGDGPNWKLRVVRKTLVRIGMNPDVLNHGIGREVFVTLLAKNAIDLLRKRDRARPDYRDLATVSEVGELARARWLVPRSQRRSEFREWSNADIAGLIDSSESPVAGGLPTEVSEVTNLDDAR